MDAHRLRARLPTHHPTIVGIHAEEAAILFANRPAAVRAPNRRLEDLATVDGRLAAHLDGLAIAGPHGARAAIVAWEAAQESGEVAVLVATHLQASPDPATVSAFPESLADSERGPARQRAVVAACAWNNATLPGWINAALPSPIAERLRIGVLACLRVPNALHADDLAIAAPHPLARAIAAVGELGRLDLLERCRAFLTAEDDDLRFQAAWTMALRQGDAAACRALQGVATSRSRYASTAAQLVARRLPLDEVNTWIEELATSHPRIAIQVAGAAGDPGRLPWLLEQMSSPDLARVAGEAVSMISGCDLAYLDLDGDPESLDEEAERFDPIAAQADSQLPWPDRLKLSAWLRAQSFPASNRLLCGRPIDVAQCLQVLASGFQRQRGSAAIELAILQPATGLFNVAAPARAQLKALSALVQAQQTVN